MQKPFTNGWIIRLDSNQSYQLYRGDTEIGRSSHSDIVLTELSVSRSHALIREREDGSFLIYDRGASTPLQLNGHRVQQPTLLRDQDMIRIGEISFRFVAVKPY